MPRRTLPPRTNSNQAAHHAQTAERPPLPAGYVCHRCGQKGHWIQDCPTNDNQDYDNRPRFKRTTGIPRSMLKTIEKPTAEQMAGVMVTPDGSYVIATPDAGSWSRSRARARTLSKTDVYQAAPSDPSLACPYCSKLLKDAVKTSCCHTTFCEECIQTYLFEHGFVCPECEKPIPDLEMLTIDDAKRKAVRAYVDKTIERSEEAFEEGARVEEEAGAAVGEAQEVEKAMNAPANDDAPAAPAPAPAAPAAAPGVPALPGMTPGETPTFQPQLVQQLAVMLQNPNLPPPMRMQLQMQLQFQQMLFMQMFPNGAEGAPAPPAVPVSTDGRHPKNDRRHADQGGRDAKVARRR